MTQYYDIEKLLGNFWQYHFLAIGKKGVDYYIFPEKTHGHWLVFQVAKQKNRRSGLFGSLVYWRIVNVDKSLADYWIVPPEPFSMNDL